MELKIVQGNLPNLSPQPGMKIVPYSELRYWPKDASIFLRHLLRYKTATLHAYRVDVIARPFLMALLLRLLSYGSIYFADTRGNTRKITLPMILYFAYRFVWDYWRSIKLSNQIKKNVQGLLAANSHSTPTQIDNTQPVLYLRTDLAFGIRSGGSVGHIAGVLNNLDAFTARPFFVSTDIVPTVHEDIEQRIIRFSPDFWDFPSILHLVTNSQIKSFAIEQLRDEEPAFIYQRHSFNNFVGVELARHYQVPFVLEYNGSEVWITKHWGAGSLKNESLALDIERLNFLAADVIVVVSQPLKDELVARGIEADKILVNPNGVDPKKYAPTIDGIRIRQQHHLTDRIVIGFIGTFDAWHGAEVLAEAFGRLLTRYPEYKENVRLLMIGDGKKMPEVQENLARHNVTDFCTLTGLVPQAEGPQHLAACDILASPHVPNPDGTPFFGSPTKLFEYMAMGKGIVASALDQIGEILSHQETAYMVEPENVDELVAGLKILIDDADLREKLGAAARRDVVAKYTWHEHTRRIIEKLRERVP